MPSAPRRALTRLARIALLAAAGDAVTKSVAALWLAGGTRATSWLGFALVHNDQGAFGLSAGAYTWQLNLALTISALALIVPVSTALERVDRLAPEALGLVAGGALGNLASLVLSPYGVLDFIALRVSAESAIVLNAADIAAYAGLAMLGRTGWRIVAAIRGGGARSALVLEGLVASSASEDVEVPRVVWVEPSAERPRKQRERPAKRRAPRDEQPREDRPER